MRRRYGSIASRSRWRDVLAIDDDRPAGRLQQLQQRAAGGGLAAAALADQAQRLARVDVKRDAVDRVDVPAGRENTPLMIGKCFFRSRTSISGCAPLAPAAVMPGSPAICRRASRRSSVQAGAVQRRIGGAALVRGEAAARREGAACGKLGSDGTMPLISSRSDAARVARARRRRVGDRAEQAARIGMPGLVEQFVERCLLDLAPGIHHHHPVGVLRDDAHVVRDQDHRGAEGLLQLAHQLEDLRLDRHVERGGRLVGDQHLRVARQRHRDHHPLAHAAGQLMRIGVGAPLRLGDRDAAQHLDRVVHRRRARDSP